MSQQKKWKYWALAIAVVAAVALIGFSLVHDAPAPTLVIVHTNDTHSQVDPATATGTPIGGAVERAALLQWVRNNEDPEAIYLDGGDDVQGSPYFNVFKGRVEMECFNQMHLLAATLGNHEFDNGVRALDSMMQWAEFPYLSCNYDFSQTVMADSPHLLESMTVNVKGVKVGLTGVSVDPENLIAFRNWDGVRYTDPSEAANRVAAQLRAEGCDLVVLLSHVGFREESEDEGDRRIARLSHDIDLIVGGHTHTNIENGYVETNADGRPVMITQTGAKMNPIGHIKIEMERAPRGSGRRYQVKSIECSKLHPEDYDIDGLGDDVEAIIAPYRTQLDSIMGVRLGTAPVMLDRDKPQGPLGNFTADALAECGSVVLGKAVDFGLMNYGGLRSPLPAGDITVGDLFRTYPFENTLTLVELKGEYVQQLIEKMAGKKLECLSRHVEVHLETHDNTTVATRVLVGGRPVDPDRYYWIATIDYVAEGNDGMRSLTKARTVRDTGVTLRDVMTGHIKALTAAGRQVEAAIDGRAVMDN